MAFKKRPGAVAPAMQETMTLRQFAISLILAALTASCGEQAVQTVTSIPIENGVSLDLAHHRAQTLSNLAYTLNLSVPADSAAAITGDVIIAFDLADPDQALQIDFRVDAAHILAVDANGEIVDWTFENEHLVIDPAYLVAGSNRLSIAFIAGDTSLNRNPDYLYTLFVPDRARTAFPLFDQPDLKATFELTLEVPEPWVAMSNAPVQTQTTEDGRSTFGFERSDLIPSYLFSFVAGEFEVVERTVGGYDMTLLHRESDTAKVARNIDEVFSLHAASLAWLEDYTDIDYPYKQFGFALIPAFQYGGMEHVGAIQYRADSLFLDESPSTPQLLSRASLIAHETAHMWFGNLVTMEWFNDVWTKEVFANFMAAKIVNPNFPDVNHDLNFLVRHYPRAYSVDRTTGANPIRQVLGNLNEAGQMYGAIIYNKAPIMMRQLELILGVDAFRDGMREYLSTFAFANATWPALIEILDRRTPENLARWSDVWVNGPGRPEFALAQDGDTLSLAQFDPQNAGRAWAQSFAVTDLSSGDAQNTQLSLAADEVQLPGSDIEAMLFNSDGKGYGRFPASFVLLERWGELEEVARGSLLINLYEILLDGNAGVSPGQYFDALQTIVDSEDNQLLLNLALAQLQTVYWRLLPEAQRAERSVALEQLLWEAMETATESSRKKVYFDAFSSIAVSADQVQKIVDVWSAAVIVEGLPVSENDRIALAQSLAIRLPAQADEIMAAQLAATTNPDNRRKLEFVAPSVSANPAVRDQFFDALQNEENRAIESWVLTALANIHHPLRTGEAEKYILPSLVLLQEIQMTGDIFFPKRWLDVTLQNYRTGTAVNTVNTFLEERPGYNGQLRMKILQSADMLFRANRLVEIDSEN